MIDTQTREHEIRCKVKLGLTLSQQEESYYLLYMATHTERYQYIKTKKGWNNATATTNYKSRNIQ